MYSIQEQVELVQLRVKRWQKKREKHLLTGLSVLCMVLTISLVGTFTMLTESGGGMVPGLYGSTMMYENAGGYVLVGLLAFGLAVVITVLCIRQKEKNNNNEHFKEEDEK